MKKSKIIIPALGMLVLSTAATVTGTVAWFTMNKTVTAEGMKISAQGQGSIIITKRTTVAAANYGLPKLSDRTTGVDFAESNAHAFFPSTHVASDSEFTTYDTGLKYVRNGEKINPETGTPISAAALAALTYNNAAVNSYFYDYDVFIAGMGDSFTDTLNISIADATIYGQNEARKNIMNAVSLDFYGETSTGGSAASVSASTYLGTLNLAGRHNTSDHATEAYNTISKANVSIPKAAESNGVGTAGYAVKMRAYFDGALIDNAGSAGYTTIRPVTASESKSDFVGDGIENEYFYNHDGYVVATIADVDGEADLNALGYEVVNYTSSTSTYARTADILEVSAVGVAVTFTLGTIA